MAKEKKIIQVDPEDTPTLENKSEISISAKNFPYLEFINKELVTLVIFEQLQGNDDGVVDMFQWIGCMLLKSVTILRSSESVVSYSI